MEHQISTHSIYVTGSARFSYSVYLAIRDRGLIEKNVEHSRFIGFQRGELAHMADRSWTTVAMCVAKKPAEKMIAISENGDVFTYVKGTATDEKIEPKPTVLRGLGVVDGLAVACGMKREVFRRIGENSWAAMHAPAPAPGENAGFEDICGFKAAEIYAVGWNGEIWEWNGRRWVNYPSPTDLILTGVCCAGDGRVYVCGQNGTLIRGRHDVWEQVELENVTDDFWDICWFKERLYVSTMTMLFVFADGGLMPVDFGTDRPMTFGRLTEAEGVLWSIGSANVFSFDGVHWTRLD